MKNIYHYAHTFSALGPSLDQDDYNTIINNVKYLALKQETINGEMKDPLVQLTKNGTSFLSTKWDKTVNKNGKTIAKKEIQLPATPPVRHADAQKYDNELYKIIFPFYTPPMG